MEDIPNFLPLGSVVSLKGNEKTLMIIGRALVRQLDDGDKEYFDYSMCLYPEGLISDTVIFSNHDCISQVHFEGYHDKAEKDFIADTSEILSMVDVKKGQPKPVSEW